MNLVCTNCNSEILSENINVSTDLAKCDHCGSVHRASELANPLINEVLAPPNGSKVILNRDLNDKVEIIYPRRGVTTRSIPVLIFTLVWLGFICFWTSMAAKGSLLFALFSIPFWIVGIRMLIGIIDSAYEFQVITCDKYKLTVYKSRLLKSKVFETDIGNVQSVKIKGMKMNAFSAFGNFRLMRNMQSSFNAPIEVPAIITGLKTVYFFEEANDAEQEWVINSLDGMVRKFKR